MKLRKTMVVLLLLVFAIGMTAFVGCGDKDNRKESEKYELVITDTKNPVSVGPNGRRFTYKYDGEEHYPTVVMMYDGKPYDIVIDISPQVFHDGEYKFSWLPKQIGEYKLTYSHDSFWIESEQIRVNIYLTVYVIIEE